MTQQGKSKDRFPLNCKSLERKKTGQDRALWTHNMSGTHHRHFSPRHQRLISPASYKIKWKTPSFCNNSEKGEREEAMESLKAWPKHNLYSQACRSLHVSSRIHPPWEHHCKSILSKSQNSRNLLVTWNRVLERTLLVVSNGHFIFNCEFFIFFCKAVQALN